MTKQQSGNEPGRIFEATPARPWPNNTEWAREDAIAIARKGRRLVIESLEEISNPVALKKLLAVQDALWEIESKLNEVGPGSSRADQ